MARPVTIEDSLFEGNLSGSELLIGDGVTILNSTFGRNQSFAGPLVGAVTMENVTMVENTDGCLGGQFRCAP